MAISNHERVGKALDLLKEGLRPFVERELKAQHAQLWFEKAKASVSDPQAKLFGTEAEPRWPVADAAAKGGALILEPLDIARERIRTHLLEGNPEPFLVVPRCARDDLLRALSRDDGPGL